MGKIINSIKINNLQYNALRDPQAYRRVAGETFRIQVGVTGNGPVRITLTDAKNTELARDELQAPATFSHELRYAEPGVHIVTITAQHADHSETRNMRLDVMKRAWAG